MEIAFRELPPFSRVRDDYFREDEEFRAFQNALAQNPRKGDVIPGCGGFRKIRWIDPSRGKGKRGGVRVVYLYLEEADFILLFTVYGKGKSEDMSADQKRILAALAGTLREEFAAERNLSNE